MEKEIVVARYNEKIDWLENLKDVKVTIYNKGSNSSPNHIILPNVGREPNTYFYHIVKNYYNLSEWTFFTQGHPFDHVVDFVDVVNNWNNEKPNVINIDDLCFFFSNGVFKGVLDSQSNGRPLHNSVLNIDGLWSSIFKDKPIQDYKFSAGCIFCVHKKQILSKKISFYEECLSQSEKRNHSPWEFERIMQYIFNKNHK